MDQDILQISSQKGWKSIPLRIGTAAPRYNDLIQFEELSDYSVSKPSQFDIEKSPISSKKKKEKEKRLKRRELLKQSLNKTEKLKILEVADNNKKSNNDKNVNVNGVVKSKPELGQKRKGKNKKSKSDKKPKLQQVQLKLEKAETKTIQPVDMTKWSNLFVPELVLKALSEEGFANPMPIQNQVLPPAIRDKRDVLGAAETGSGKTLAFGIPLIYHLLEDKRRTMSKNNVVITEPVDNKKEVEDEDLEDLPSDFEDDVYNVEEELEKNSSTFLPALVLTPTRELAVQVKNHITKAAKYTGLLVVAVVGGMAPQKQIRQLNKRPDIVIATPGRLHALMDEGHPYLSNMHLLRYLVIDEADRMLEKGHFEELNKLLAIMKIKDANKKRQTFVFSATLTTVHLGSNRAKFRGNETSQSKSLKLEKLVKRIGIQNKPFVADLTTKKFTAEKLSESKIICETAEKDYYLYYFIKSNPGRTLVFTNSIDCIFHLSGVLEALGCNPLHIHAKMQQRQRLKHLDRFQADPNSVMIASDVAARGLDIPDVKHVVHYQVPRTMETYIHRSGRSARSGKEGTSVMFVSSGELGFYKRICKSLEKEDGIPLFDVNISYLAAVKKRVNIAKEVDKLSHKQKKVRLHNDWFSKNAEAMDICLDEDLLINTSDSKDVSNDIKMKKQQLDALLKRPIFPKGFSNRDLTRGGRVSIPDISLLKKSF